MADENVVVDGEGGDLTPPADGVNPDPVDTPADGDAPADSAPAEPEATPEPIEYDLTVGEGSMINDAHLGEFKEVAQELGLNNEQAQKLVSMQDSFVAGLQAQATEQWGKQVEAWANEVKADPELGGDNWATTDQHLKAALDAFGSDALKEALNSTGYGNHPDLVRFVAAVGKSLAEDKQVGGNDNAGGPKDLVAELYGKS